MRIGVCGTHGTGKTTLCEILSERLNIPLITEQARVAAREFGFENLNDMLKEDINTIKSYQERILQLQIQEEANRDSFITDRTTLDMASYMALWSGDITFNLFTPYYINCSSHARNYDLIFYIPIEFDLEDDGFRTMCPICRRTHDNLIRYVFTRYYQNRPITIMGSVEERVQKVMDYIEAWRSIQEHSSTRRGVHVFGGFDDQGQAQVRHYPYYMTTDWSPIEDVNLFSKFNFTQQLESILQREENKKLFAPNEDPTIYSKDK